MGTNSEQVKIFTEESNGSALPEYPRAMNTQETVFIVKMVSEELLELLATVAEPGTDLKELLVAIVNNCTPPTYTKEGKSEDEIIAEQVDAFVDVHYYNCNAATKVGMNVDDAFKEVHKANMAKKFDDGKFTKIPKEKS